MYNNISLSNSWAATPALSTLQDVLQTSKNILYPKIENNVIAYTNLWIQKADLSSLFPDENQAPF